MRQTPGYRTATGEASLGQPEVPIHGANHPGFGRTGESMWGFGRHGVIPDLVTLGKPMGNEYPIAGVVMRPEVIAEFGHKVRFFNTFGGNPVACAAAFATLEVIQEEGLMENALTVGNYLMSGLQECAQRYRSIGDVRGAGLYTGRDRDLRDEGGGRGSSRRYCKRYARQGRNDQRDRSAQQYFEDPPTAGLRQRARERTARGNARCAQCKWRAITDI
jgi:hypothetical protein